MQVGAADTLVGELVDHLRALPTWDGHAARRHVRPRHQPHAARHRPDEGHRRQPRGGVPRAAVHQGAGPGRRRDPRRQRPEPRRAPVDRRPPRRRRRLGVRRPLPVRRQRGPHRAEGVDRRRRRDRDRRTAGARSSRTATTGSALAAVGDNGDLVGTEVADLDVGDPSEWRATLDQAELFDALPTDDGELPFVLAGTVTGGPCGAARSCSPR